MAISGPNDGSWGGNASLEEFFLSDTGVYSDAGSTAATDEDAVAEWHSMATGSSAMFSELSGDAGPEFEASSENGEPALVFDGSSGAGMELGSAFAHSDFTLWIVWKAPTTPDNNECPFALEGRARMLWDSSGGEWVWRRDDSAANISTGCDDDLHVLTMRVESSPSEAVDFKVDNGSWSTQSGIDTRYDQGADVDLGQFNGGSECPVHILAIGWCSSALSDSDEAEMADFLGNKYGLWSSGATRTAEAASVTATAQDAEASAEMTVTAQHGSVTATAQDAEHSASIDVTAQGASVTATAQDASYTIGAVTRTAQHASVTATVQEPSITIGATSRTAEHGSVTVTAKDAVASVSITVTAEHGSVTATAKDATASASIDVTASKGSVTAVAQEPTVTIGATERTAEKASVTATAKDASTSAAAATRTAEKATVTATAQDASFEAAIGVTAEHGSVQATAKDATATSSTVTDERTAEKATVTATAQDASYTIGDTSRTALHASVQATASDATATAVFNATALKASVSANANDAVAEAVAQIEALAASVSAIARAPSFTIGATSRTAVKATVTATAKDAVAASGLDPVNPITIDRYSGGITVNNRTVLAANMSQATLTIDMDTTQETDKSNHPMRIDK